MYLLAEVRQLLCLLTWLGKGR